MLTMQMNCTVIPIIRTIHLKFVKKRFSLREYHFTTGDFPADRTVLMTTKDEVKCREFAQKSWWAVDQEIILPDQLIENIERIIGQRIANG